MAISLGVYPIFRQTQINIDPENDQFLVETNLPTPDDCQGRTVNLLEGNGEHDDKQMGIFSKFSSTMFFTKL